MPHHPAIHFVPLFPAWAIALLAALLAALLLHGTALLRRKRVPANWVAMLAVLRLAIIVVLMVGLLGPVVSFSRSVPQLPDLLVLLDTSQSMGAKGSAGATRLEEAVARLRHGELAQNLREHFNVHWFAFDRSAVPVEEPDLASLKPGGDATRYAESLSAAWDYQRQAGAAEELSAVGAAAPRRVLLVSDGNDLSSQDVVETARKLGVCLDTLAVGNAGPNQPASKVVIASVQSPRRVLLGSETQILVTLRADGAVAGPVVLSLTEGDKPLVAQEVRFRSGQTEQQVRLTHRPGEVGLRQQELRLKSQAASTGEPYPFSVRVVDNKKEVLILEESWRWEFKFLRRVIEDDPSFSFTAFLARGSGMFSQFGESDRRVNLGGFPQSRSELEWFDLIVLGDVNPRRWPASLAEALRDVVTQEGKSLVVIAGPNLASLAATPELASLLPVELTRESATPLEGPIDVKLSREGAASPFFANAAPANLPPLDRVYPPLRKRPAATILLETARQANVYGNLIVVAEQTVGRGRVLFVGTDTLWKWQMSGPQNEAAATPQSLFWQQALRALAPVESRGGGVSLTLQPERSRYEAGRRVALTAQYTSDRPLPQPVLEATVTLPDNRQVPLALAPDPAAPNTFHVEFETTSAGQYKIAATVQSLGKPLADVLTAIDVEAPRGEASSTGVDRANLARIAAATAGQSVEPTDRSTWPASQKAELPTHEQLRHFDLWNSLTLLLVLSLLLGLDWSLRLLRGYV